MASKMSTMHDPVVTANALGATGALLYLVCVLFVGFSRPTFMSMMGGWFHGVNVMALPYAPMMGGSIVFGLFTFAVASWLTGYVFASFYNWFAKK